MNYDPRLAAVCGDARLPSHRMGRQIKKDVPVLIQEFCEQLGTQTQRSTTKSQQALNQRKAAIAEARLPTYDLTRRS